MSASGFCQTQSERSQPFRGSLSSLGKTKEIKQSKNGHSDIQSVAGQEATTEILAKDEIYEANLRVRMCVFVS